MSAKGNCYDNACAKSFFHSLKVEAIQGDLHHKNQYEADGIWIHWNLLQY